MGLEGNAGAARPGPAVQRITPVAGAAHQRLPARHDGNRQSRAHPQGRQRGSGPLRQQPPQHPGRRGRLAGAGLRDTGSCHRGGGQRHLIRSRAVTDHDLPLPKQPRNALRCAGGEHSIGVPRKLMRARRAVQGGSAPSAPGDAPGTWGERPSAGAHRWRSQPGRFPDDVAVRGKRLPARNNAPGGLAPPTSATSWTASTAECQPAPGRSAHADRSRVRNRSRSRGLPSWPGAWWSFRRG